MIIQEVHLMTNCFIIHFSDKLYTRCHDKFVVKYNVTFTAIVCIQNIKVDSLLKLK